LLTTWTTLFTTTHATTIIRDIELVNLGPTAETLYLSVQPPAPASSASLLVVPNLAATSHFQWQGRVVLELGAQLLGYCAATGTTALISGYVFDS
jgi:hypothetical protein